MNEPSPSGNQAIERIIGRLAKAVQKLPLESMISSMWIPGEPAVSHKVQELEVGVRDAIKQLSMLAGSGREDAIIALRDIGNLAAMELRHLSSDAIRSDISTAFPGPFSDQAIFSRPVAEIQGDLSSIFEILKSEENTIETLSENAIRESIQKHRIADRGRLVVNALAALGFPQKILEEHQLNTSVDSVYFKHPDPILKAHLATIQRDSSKTPQEKEQERTQIVLFELIQHLLEAQFEALAVSRVSKLPQISLEWPMCVSTFSRDVKERFLSLNLGGSLPFRPRGSKSNVGRPIEFAHGSPVHFALEYCTALEDVRRSHLDFTEDKKAEWEDTIARIETALKNCKIADPSNNHANERYHGVSLCILWTYKASLLPEFPSLAQGSNVAASGDLKPWLDAAVARARMLCWNDWENYNRWPECVETRRYQSTNRGRSAESVVREKLSEGMKKIEAVPRAVR